MMNHKAIAVKQHNFTLKDKLFLDANIWLYLYCPQGSREYWVNIYSDVFDRILDAESQIYIDVLVVSEFINRFTKQEMGVCQGPVETRQSRVETRRFTPKVFQKFSQQSRF